MKVKELESVYLRIELEVKTELVIEGLNEQGGPVEVFPRLQTQTQTQTLEIRDYHHKEKAQLNSYEVLLTVIFTWLLVMLCLKS
jgi:hypothetical protein